MGLGTGAGVGAGTGSGRVDYLDGIRALAIGCVLAVHWVSWYSPFLHGGSIGVDVFFVLSGFIITTVLWRGPATTSTAYAWGVFVRRRLVRLYPALLGLVAGSAVLYAATPGGPPGLDGMDGLDGAEVARRGLLVLAQTGSFWAAAQEGSFWLPALEPFGHAWSLAVEWYFYLLWPLVVLAARRRGWDALRLARVTLAGAAVLYVGSLPLDAFWFYFGPSARFAELMVGGALALHLQARATATDSPAAASRREALLPGLALAAVVLYATFAPDAHSDVYRWVGVPLAVGATVVLVRTGYDQPGHAVHRLLSHPWMALVGRHSYSLYLWHLAPLLLLADTDLPKPVLGALTVAAVTVLTVASHRWLEQPFLRPRSDALRPQHAPVRERGDEVVG